jgi:hypothetical protein
MGRLSDVKWSGWAEDQVAEKSMERLEWGGIGIVGPGEVRLSEVKSGQQANKNLVTSIIGLDLARIIKRKLGDTFRGYW